MGGVGDAMGARNTRHAVSPKGPELRCAASSAGAGPGTIGEPVKRVHPIHIVTLGVAILGAVFAFIAMQVAFDARDAASSAAANDSGDNGQQIRELQLALVRAGIIDDPTVVPIDYRELGGPWSQCLTADDREEMGLGPDDVELPPACDVVPVSFDERCPEPTPPTELADDDPVDVDTCEVFYVVDGRRFEYWEQAHPFDVEAEADEWFRADSDDRADRVARGEGLTFVHLVDEGWLRLESW